MNTDHHRLEDNLNQTPPKDKFSMSYNKSMASTVSAEKKKEFGGSYDGRTSTMEKRNDYSLDRT